MTTDAPALAVIRRSEGRSLLTECDLPPEQHFIDGQFRAGSSGVFVDVIDPCVALYALDDYSRTKHVMHHHGR